MTTALISRSIIVVFGLLYPAYNSYKAIRTRNVSQYVKWMMYWIVFALFYNVETVADLLVSWFPMYYELKIIFVIWLLSPATQGAEVLYSLYIHPRLVKHEQEIEETIQKVKTQGYSTLLNVGAQGMNMALQGAIAGQTKLAEQLKRSYSLDAFDGPLPYEPMPVEEIPQDDENESILTRDRVRVEKDSPHTTLRHRHRSGVLQDSITPTPIPDYSTTRPTRNQPFDNQPITNSPRKRLERPLSTPSFKPGLSRSSSMKADALETRSQTLLRSSSSKTFGHHSMEESHTQKRQARPRAAIVKSVTRPAQKGKETKQPEVRDSNAAVNETDETSDHIAVKSKWTESTLRYRTKKISDIKHQKIKSPFVSLW